MSEATVEIAGHELVVDYEFAEFEIEVFGLRFPKRHADVPELEMPEWLKDILTTHLYERDDINNIVQQADYERGSGDPDWERDLRNEDRELARDDERD